MEIIVIFISCRVKTKKLKNDTHWTNRAQLKICSRSSTQCCERFALRKSAGKEKIILIPRSKLSCVKKSICEPEIVQKNKTKQNIIIPH
jgi:hypothetical protein